MKILRPKRKLTYKERILRAKARAQKKRRGVALILVLGAIVILTVFVTDLEVTSSAALSAALAERDSEKAEYHARSALNLSRLLIGSEPTIRTTISPIIQGLLGQRNTFKQLPIWKFQDVILGPFNDISHGQAFANAVGVDLSDQGGGKGIGLKGGHFEVKIVDEDSKIDLNSAVAGDAFSRQRLAMQLLGVMAPQKYTPMFEHLDSDGQYSDRPTICGAIIDWADFDETFYPCDPFGNAPQNDSAEDNFYQQAGLPYLRKNAPFDSLDEVRLVRGISDNYWATFVDPEPDDPDQRVMTVWGQGQVNVNTANGLTLLGIICGGAPDAKLCTDEDQMERFVEAVSMAKVMVPGMPLWGSPRMFTRTLSGKGSSAIAQAFQALQIEPVTWRSETEVQKAITVESKVFSVYAEGVVPRQKTKDKCQADSDCATGQTCADGFCADATRIRIHAVVDFRNASALGSQATNSSGTPPTSQPGGGPIRPPTAVQPGAARQQPQATTTGSSSQSSQSDIMAAYLTDPAGQIIYYRVE